MATKAELYLLLLQELERSTTGILSTAIVTLDGLIMSNTSSDKVDKDTFAAYSAATFRRAGEAMEELSDEDIDMLLFESQKHRVIIIRAGDYSLLIALTGKDAQIGIVLLEMQRAVKKIKGI